MQKIAEPPKEELEKLLFDQLLSKRKIAQSYGVCMKVVTRWLNTYNLKEKAITKELQQLKRDKTRELNRKGVIRKIVRPGFNSEFLEEYAVEEEMRKRQNG